MAKKNDEKNLIQLALDSHKWINTPTVYTTFGSNFTLLQQDVMLQVSSQLQDYVKRYLDEGRYLDPNSPKPIFTKQELSDGLKPIRIELSSLGIGDGHYDRMNDALQSMRDLWFKAPVFDKETGIKKGDDWFPIFKKIFIPTSETNINGDLLAYKNKNEEKVATRKDGYIEVSVNEEVAIYVFDMTQGYFNHLERIALYCRSAYTSRIYLLLMQYVSRHQMMIEVEYMKLKEYLGMIEREPKSEEIKSIKYEKFSQFSKMVLDVAQKDMNRLSSENKTEIVFEYEPVYMGRVKRGDPAKIRFKVSRSPLGVAREIELHRPSSEKKLIGWLQKEFVNADMNEIQQIVHGVDDKIWEQFKKYVYVQLKSDIDFTISQRSNPENKDKMAVTMIKRWIYMNTNVQASLFDDAPKKEVPEAQKPTDFAQHILDDIRAELGNGQMGYDYYFGASTQCRVEIDKVVITGNKFSIDTARNTPSLIERVGKVIARYYPDKQLSLEYK